MSKEFKIGLITIIAGSLLYYGFNFLRGSDVFSKTNRYYVVYPNVSGLSVSNPVLFNGLRVGRVSALNLQQTRNRIVVAVDIERSFTVNKMDTASLANNDFFGTKAIILHPGSDPNQMQPGDTLNANIDEDILSQLEPVANNITSTLQKVDELLVNLTKADFEGLVDTLKYSLGSITSEIEKLDLEVTNDTLMEVMSSFKSRSEELSGVLVSSKSLLDSLNQLPLDQTLAALTTTLEEATAMIQALQDENGSVGKMMKDDSLYNNLNAVFSDLDKLIIHFNNYPRDFMKPLGRKNKKLRGLEEETATDK